jgi:hypothetical protein
MGHHDVDVVQRVGEVGGQLGRDLLDEVLGGAHHQHPALAEQRRAEHVGQVAPLQLGRAHVAHVDLGIELTGGPDDGRDGPRDQQVLLADHDGQGDQQRSRHVDHRPTAPRDALAARRRSGHRRRVRAPSCPCRHRC